MTFERTLRQEIADLRAAVNRLKAAAAPRLHLRIFAAGPRAFLGQPLALSAAAHWVSQGPAGGEEPARDLPLTFVTSWGSLRAADIYADTSGAQVGSSVTVHTGLDGVARVTLLPPGMGQLDAAQQSALWTALDRLDANVATPADLQPQLAELVDAYRWEANLLLRQAVDILHSANGAPIDGMTREDALAAWRQVNATVVAIAAEGAQVSAAALHTVRALDWLRPWLQVYRQRTQRDEGLARDLARTRRRRSDPRGLLDGVYRDINQYVNRQLGQIGQVMGQRAAENALRSFVQEGLADLPAATRTTLFPTLQVASETVTGAGVHVLSALTQARVDLRQEIGAQAAVTGSLEQALTGKLDASAFEGFRSAIDASVGALDAQTRTLSTQVVAAASTTETMLGQLSVLQSSFGQLTTDFGTLQISLGDLSGRITDVATDLSGQLSGRVTVGELAVLQTTIQASLDSALQQKADLQIVDSLRADLTEQIGTRLSAGDLAAFQATVDAALQQKADLMAVDGLRADLSAQLADRITSDEFKSFRESNTADLNRKANAASLTSLRNELSGLIAGKADVAALEAIKLENEGRFADLATSTDKISAQMEEVNRSLADINDRFGGLRGELTAQLEQNQLALTQALSAVERLQGTLGTLPIDLGTRLAVLEEQTQGVTTSLTDFEKTVTTLNRNFTSLNKRILDSGILRPPP